MQPAEMVEVHTMGPVVPCMGPSAMIRGPHHPMQVTLDNPLARVSTFPRRPDYSPWNSPTRAMGAVQTSTAPHMLQPAGGSVLSAAAAAPVPAYELRTLFFGHVPDRVQEHELIHLFSRCGTVVDVVLFRQFPKSKYSRGCGLVEFATEQAASAALAALHGAHIWPDSRAPLNLEFMVASKCQRGPQPRKPRPYGTGTGTAALASSPSGPQLTPAEAADKQARTLFFAAVPPRVIDAELRTLFASCGEVVELLLFRRYPKCIPSKGCGLVEFRTKQQADFAVASLNNNVMWPDSFKPMLLEPGLSATDRSQRRTETEYFPSATGGTAPGSSTQQVDAAAAAAVGLLLVPGPAPGAWAEVGPSSSRGSSQSGTPNSVAAGSSAAMAFTPLGEAPGMLTATAMPGSSSAVVGVDGTTLLALPGGGGVLPGPRPTQTQLAAAAMAAQRELGGKPGAVQTSFTLLEPLKGPPPPSPAAPLQPRGVRPQGSLGGEQQQQRPQQVMAARHFGHDLYAGGQQLQLYGDHQMAGAVQAVPHYGAYGAAYSMPAAAATAGAPQPVTMHHQQLHELAGMSLHHHHHHHHQQQQVVWMMPGGSLAYGALPYTVNEAPPGAAYTPYKPCALDQSLAGAAGVAAGPMPTMAVSAALACTADGQHFTAQSSAPVTGVHALLASSAGTPVDVLAPAFAGQLDLGPAAGGLLMGGTQAGSGQPTATSGMTLGAARHSTGMLFDLLQQQGMVGSPQHALGSHQSPFMPAAAIAGPHASGPAVVAPPALSLGMATLEGGMLFGRLPVATTALAHGHNVLAPGHYRMV